MSHNTKEQWHCFTLIFIPKRVRDAWQLCSSLPKSDSQIWCSGGSGGEELGPFPSWVRKEKRSCTVSVCYVSWSNHRQQAVKSYTEWKWSRFSHSVSKWYCCGPQDKTWLYLVLYGDMRADRNVVKLDHQSVFFFSRRFCAWWQTEQHHESEFTGNQLFYGHCDLMKHSITLLNKLVDCVGTQLNRLYN